MIDRDAENIFRLFVRGGRPPFYKSDMRTLLDLLDEAREDAAKYEEELRKKDVLLRKKDEELAATREELVACRSGALLLEEDVYRLMAEKSLLVAPIWRKAAEDRMELLIETYKNSRRILEERSEACERLKDLLRSSAEDATLVEWRRFLHDREEAAKFLKRVLAGE